MALITIDDRKKEMHILLDKMRAAPSQDWTQERERVLILQKMIEAASHQPA
ncbi:MAG: hypothetical protein ABI395_02900 [Sphingobium sp.]